MSLKILRMGDPHIRPSNIEESEKINGIYFKSNSIY